MAEKREGEAKGKDDAVAVRPEEKFKLSMLSMEKRFVDLEFAISEVAARVKDVDPEGMKSLGSRIGALEDMINVEQAGVLELKRIMQGVDDDFKSIASEKDVEETHEAVKRAESLARAAAEMADLPAKLDENTRKRFKELEDGIAELKRSTIETISPLEVEEIRRSLDNMREHSASLAVSVDDLKSNMDRRIQDSVKSMRITAADSTFVNNKIESLRKTVEALSASVDKRIQDGVTGSQAAAGADYAFVNAKIETLKKAVDAMAAKRIENELKAAQIEQRLAEIISGESSEGPISEKMLEEVRGMRRELEGARIRMDAIERVVKKTAKTAQDASTAARRFEGFERLSRLQEDIDDKLRQFKSMQDELGRLSNGIESMYEDFDRRLSDLRNAKRDVEDVNKLLADTRKDVDGVKAGLKRAVSKEELSDVTEALEGMDSMAGKVEQLESQVRRLDTAYSHIETQPAVSTEMLSLVKEMDDRLGEAEAQLADVRRTGVPSAAAAEPGGPDVESRLTEIVDRLVYLESRLTALESIFQTSSKTQAMIIE